LSREAPRRHRMTTTRGTTFTTTMGVIDRVHRHAANGRTDALPALGTGFTQRTQAVLGVRDFAQGGTALSQHLARFTGAKTQRHIGTLTRNQLRRSTSGTSDLSTLARLQFDTMNGGTQRDVAQRQAVTGFDRRIDARQQLITSAHALRRDDVATLTVGILQQRDVRSTVRVVFDTLDDGRNAILVAAKIDQTVMLLVTTANVASGDATVVVTATCFRLLLEQRSIGSALVQLLADHLDHKAAARGSRFAFNDCHDAPLPYSALPEKSISWPG